MVFPDGCKDVYTRIFSLESENGCFRLLVSRQVFIVLPLSDFYSSRSTVVNVATAAADSCLAVMVELLLSFLFGGRHLVL